MGTLFARAAAAFSTVVESARTDLEHLARAAPGVVGGAAGAAAAAATGGLSAVGSGGGAGGGSSSAAQWRPRALPPPPSTTALRPLRVRGGVPLALGLTSGGHDTVVVTTESVEAYDWAGGKLLEASLAEGMPATDGGWGGAGGMPPGGESPPLSPPVPVLALDDVECR